MNYVDQALADAVGQMVNKAYLDIGNALARSIAASANSRTSQQLLRFSRELATPAGADELRKANAEMAKRMKLSTIASFGQAKTRFRKTPRYRAGLGRDSGGLESVLQSNDWIEVTATGIGFGNVAALDAKARHWARLNFGAGPAGRGSNERFAVTFSNLPALEFDFSAEARPGYRLPAGFWKGGEHGVPGDQFHPRKGATQDGPGSRPTKGNIGYNFLDAGVRRYFHDFAEVYGYGPTGEGLFGRVGYTRGRPATIRGDVVERKNVRSS